MNARASTVGDKARPRDYERRDVRPRGVLLAGLGLLFGTMLSALLVFGLFAWWRADRPAADSGNLAAVALAPSPPRLEITPQGDRAEIEAAARRLIEGYAWVDETRGRVRIPIDRAMALLAERGWPAAQNDPEAAP